MLPLVIAGACSVVPAPTLGLPSAPPSTVATAWVTRTPAPLPVTEVAGAALDGRIYLAGGFAADGSPVTAVQVYDPANDSWSRGPELPEPVHHSALVARGSELHLVGGYVGPTFENPTDAVRRLDRVSGGWVDGPPLPSPRAAGAAAFDGTRIVYGGGVGPQRLAGDVVALEGSSWRRVGALSMAREHLAAASDGAGRVWFLGGRTAGLDTNLGTVDLVQGGSVRALGALPTPRGGVAGFYSPAVGACLVGGEAPTGTQPEVECVTAGGTVVGLPRLTAARHGLAAAIVDGVAYALAGGPRPGLAVSAAVESLQLI